MDSVWEVVAPEMIEKNVNEKDEKFYFEFFSVSMQDLFETLNYVDRYYLNLHRDEVLRPKEI